MYRTPSHKIHSEKNYSLFHYYLKGDRSTKQAPKFDASEKSGSTYSQINKHNVEKSKSIPLLIIYAFINRNYILDLLPNSSIVKNFQDQGFDVYTTDWGTSSPYDKNLTLENYVNGYLVDALNHIKDHSNTDKVSILGYCWGGDLALMLAALYPEKIET